MARQQTKAPSEPGDRARPVQSLRHRSIKLSIWRNDTGKGPMYNVTIVRGFRSDDGEGWRDSHSFGYDDLPVIAKLLNDAHGIITTLREKDAAVVRKAGERRSGASTG
jgi:hypothetical protein